MKAVIIISVCLIVVGCFNAARGSGLSFADNQDFAAGYCDFSNTGPLYLSAYPFASIDKKYSLQTSYRSLYGLDELADNRAAVSIVLNKIQFGIGVATFGKADYFHQLGLSFSSMYKFHQLSLGGSIIYSRLSFNDTYEDVSLASSNFGLSYNHREGMVFGVVRALNQPNYTDKSVSLPRQLEFGISYKTQTKLDSQAKIMLSEKQKPAAELSQSFYLADFVSLNWTLVMEPVRFGGGIKIEKSYFDFEYKLSHNPILGMTQTVSLGIFGR